MKMPNLCVSIAIMGLWAVNSAQAANTTTSTSSSTSTNTGTGTYQYSCPQQLTAYKNRYRSVYTRYRRCNAEKRHLAQTLEKSSAENQSSRDRVAQLEVQLLDKESHVNNLKADLDELEIEVNALRVSNNRKDRQISELIVEKSNLQSSLVQVQTDNQLKDATILENNRTIADLEARIAELNNGNQIEHTIGKTPGELFGSSVVINGRYVAVPYADNSLVPNRIRIYRKDDAGWILMQTLGASLPEGQELGYSMAMKNDLLAVYGANGAGSTIESGGNIFVFKQSENGNYKYDSTIHLPFSYPGLVYDQDVEVELDENNIITSGQQRFPNKQSWVQSGNGWFPRGNGVPTNYIGGFSKTTAAWGNWIAIGSTDGKVYVYKYENDIWSLTQTIDGSSNDFAHDIEMNNNFLVVSEYHYGNNPAFQSRVHIYRYDELSGQYVANSVLEDQSSDLIQLGNDLSLKDNQMAVSSLDANGNAGLHLFDLNDLNKGAQWQHFFHVTLSANIVQPIDFDGSTIVSSAGDYDQSVIKSFHIGKIISGEVSVDN